MEIKNIKIKNRPAARAPPTGRGASGAGAAIGAPRTIVRRTTTTSSRTTTTRRCCAQDLARWNKNWFRFGVVGHVID